MGLADIKLSPMRSVWYCRSNLEKEPEIDVWKLPGYTAHLIIIIIISYSIQYIHKSYIGRITGKKLGLLLLIKLNGSNKRDCSTISTASPV